MHVPAWPLGEPVADFLRLVRRVAVHDDVDVEALGHVGLDVVQEPAELPASVATEALADDLAGGVVEGGEERGRTIGDL